MASCLIIANQTLAGEELLGEVGRRIDAGQCDFYVVVPATPIRHALAWEEGESLRAARERLQLILEWLRSRGADADGEIGDRDPIAAARDALRRRPAEHIILSTLPIGRSRWIGQDIPSRLRSAVGMPIQVVTAKAVKRIELAIN
jgi:GABA permease